MTNCVELFQRFIKETPGYHEFDFEDALFDFGKWLKTDNVDLEEVIKCIEKAERQWGKDYDDNKEWTRYDRNPDSDYFIWHLKKRFEKEGE
jgi:hypothetical protein